MRIALYVSIYPGQEIQTPPSLQYLAGYLLKNELLQEDEILFAKGINEILAFRPDILGIGSVSQTFNDAVNVCEVVKKALPKCWSILGGYHISALPESLPSSFDIGVLGEGEITFAELVSLKQRSSNVDDEELRKINGICFRNERDEIEQTPKRNLIEKIDSLRPFRRIPDRQEWAYLFTARGCPYKCVYCASQSFWNSYRYHSAEYIVDEIGKLYEKQYITSFYFVDDLFIAPKSRLKRIYQLLKEKGWLGRLRFNGFIRVNMFDEDVCILLKEMGFVEVRFGMETASEKLLASIKSNPFTIKQAEDVIDCCNRHNLPVCASFMFGIPGETENDIEATRQFLLKHKDNFRIAGFYLMQPVPGSGLWDNLVKDKRISLQIDFSFMELDLSRKNFDWSKIIYLNQDVINIERFKTIIALFKSEFIDIEEGVGVGSLEKGDRKMQSVYSYIEKIKGALSTVINRPLNYIGLELRQIKTGLPPKETLSNSFKQVGGRLYVGCGEDNREGYTGCDSRELPNVKIVCKAWEVSRYCSDLGEIYSRHMLEHLTWSECEETLRDWLRALKLGGKLQIVVPNIDFHIEQWQRANWNEESWSQQFSDARHAFAGFWGWQREVMTEDCRTNNDRYWDVHKSGYNEESISFLLKRAGFGQINCKILDKAHLVAEAVKTMDTAERQISPNLSGVRADHKGRYEFASGYLNPDSVVLDIACGVGYGSFIIAGSELCKKVIAVDGNREALEYGKNFYSNQKIEYTLSDCNNFEFDENSIDLIVCFETIEHLESDHLFLKRINNFLKTDGTLICSSPNQEKLQYLKSDFPYHFRHYTPIKFERLLTESGFTIIRKCSQHDNKKADIVDDWNGSFLIAVCKKN